MCGIVGILRQTNDAPPVDRALIVGMRDMMIHRGPDGAGVWVDDEGTIGLGHRRLSIIDLDERAAQPMASDDGRFVLTFNGEIYNYLEVRAELEASGVSRWRTSSDTEVLLNAFRHWGIGCLSRLRGMFAFAVWDAQEKQLWLVRDRIGVKPLYYAVGRGRLAFASEIKAIVAVPGQPREMDETSLFHFLSLMTTPPPHTMFKGIDKLPGGSWLRAGADGLIEIRRYWDALEEAQLWRRDLPKTEEELIEALRAELADAVSYRGVADVPVGVFLSGGIDSSANAALFAKSQGKKIKTFSIGYEGKNASYENELHFARMMAEQIGSDHHERLLRLDELIDLLPRIVHLQDEPIADPVCFPVYCVSELARSKGIAVAQVGEGADELFAGYPSWHRILKMQAAVERLGHAGAALASAGLVAIGKRDGLLAQTLSRSRTGEPFFWSGAEIFTGRRKEAVLSQRMRDAFAGRSSSEAITEIHGRFTAKAEEPSALNWMTYVDLNLRLPELLLMRVDKMSMGVSLECREPFLDHRLVGLALALPTSLKLAGDTPKSVLKKAVRGLVPDRLIDRRKQGFGVPIQDWFLKGLGPVVREEIDGFLTATDVLDRSTVNDLFARQDGVHLWFLYNLAAWHRHFIREWDRGGRAAA